MRLTDDELRRRYELKLEYQRRAYLQSVANRVERQLSMLFQMPLVFAIMFASCWLLQWLMPTFIKGLTHTSIVWPLLGLAAAYVWRLIGLIVLRWQLENNR